MQGEHISFWRLPTDLLDLTVSYLYNIPAYELIEDLHFFLRWQQQVPAMFLSCTLMDSRYLFAVANPMRRYHPYTPRRFLHMQPADIWASTLPALVNMLDAEKVRGIKSYKGCIRRWTHECVTSRKLEFYTLLCKKALIKLGECHFRRSFPVFFVREALRQTRALYEASARVSPSPLAM